MTNEQAPAVDPISHQRLLRAAQHAQRFLIGMGQALGESTPHDMVDVMNELERAIQANGGKIVTLGDHLLNAGCNG